MCLFSGHVDHVSATRIFARGTEGNLQFLAYAMHVAARSEVAMILPLPVPPSPGDDAVRFIDLSDYPSFFKDLERGFPKPITRSAPGVDHVRPASAPKPLVVHDVGAYEASFVPTAADFVRLDARFRLPGRTLTSVPKYADWGFAVFKLRGLSGDKPAEFHPMAFEFPRRDPKETFFPMTHVHDGEAHADALYDHTVYGQLARKVRGWECSPEAAGAFMDLSRAQGMLDPTMPCMKRVHKGLNKNMDWEIVI